MATTDLNANEVADEELVVGDDLFDGFGDDLDIIDTDDGEVTEESAAEDEEDESESEDHAEEESDEAEAESTNDKAESKEEIPATKYTLKHLDDAPREYTADELVPLAQKGLDYDRIRTERDGMKENYAKYEQYAKFLENIKGKFDTIEDLMDDTNATLLVKNEADNGRTVTKEEALKRVKANRESEMPKAKEKEPAKPSQNELRAAEVRKFTQTLASDGLTPPKWDELPKEVRDAFEKTGELTVPYYRWLSKQKDQENKTIKQNKTNKERSTGSRKSKGKTDSNNPIYAGWGDD